MAGRLIGGFVRGGGVVDELPIPTYTGQMQLSPLGPTKGYARFLTSGELVFLYGVMLDVFLVGGGASGGGASRGGGGGGGYTKTYKRSSIGWKDGGAIFVPANTPFSIEIGQGGAAVTTQTGGNRGGTTRFGGFEAEGGFGGGVTVIRGGNGGSAGGNHDGGELNGPGASDGGSRLNVNGQGHTTREFGEASGTPFSGGGAGGTIIAGSFWPGGDGGGGRGSGGTGNNPQAQPGQENTGSGGGGAGTTTGIGAAGGSGIVTARWGSGWEDAHTLSQMALIEEMALEGKNLKEAIEIFRGIRI